MLISNNNLLSRAGNESEEQSKTQMLGDVQVDPAGWQRFNEWVNPGFSQHGTCSG